MSQPKQSVLRRIVSSTFGGAQGQSKARPGQGEDEQDIDLQDKSPALWAEIIEVQMPPAKY